MKIKLKKIEQGICPYCGSDDIDYGAIELKDDMMAYYPAHCNECEKDFDEWYSLTFTGHNVGDGLDIITDAGQEGVEIEVEGDDEDSFTTTDEPFHCEEDIMDIADYLEVVGCPRENADLQRFGELQNEDEDLGNLWDYSLSEIDHCVKAVGGKFVIVRFPNMYGGYDYRMCQLPDQ